MASLAETLWSQTIPLHITHPSQPNNPFVTNLPRFSYLALLLPRLSAFFHDADTPISSFHHEDVLLRNLPLGLLVDLYAPPLPWRLTVGDGPSWDMADTFLNGVKEADFTRYGTAKRIMSLSKADTSTLWHAVQDNDHAAFARASRHLTGKRARSETRRANECTKRDNPEMNNVSSSRVPAPVSS
ncbi:Putative galacturan 1,4-alpha-galacturonidase B [Verticillium dahliae VDG1]|nr:Putative galacturan 1,4-alpha-galacturonidase B [Verticillium dahliae VDG1]